MPLFLQQSALDFVPKARPYAQAAVAEVPEADVLSRPLGSIADELLGQFVPEMIVLDESGIFMRADEAVIENNDWGMTRHIKTNKYTFCVPFRGNQDLFRIRPSTYTTQFPEAGVKNGQLEFELLEHGADATSLKSRFDAQLQLVKQYLEWLAADIQTGVAALRGEIVSELSKRKQMLDAQRAVVANLGIPLRRRGDADQVAVPVTRKMLAVTNTGARPKHIAEEPFLGEKAYDEILDVLAATSVLIERNPTTFARIPEAVLRDHFLLQLNGVFEGGATGETFNFKGKTDILIRHENKNVFIAECKYWTGPKSLTGAIDQLFGYLTWRDTKAAILLFSKNVDFSGVLAEAETALREHPQHRAKLEVARATAFRARLARPGDESRLITLTVLVFNVPHG